MTIRIFRSFSLLLSIALLTFSLFTVYGYFSQVLPDFTAGNYWSYFTIQSNVLSVGFMVYLLFMAVTGKDSRHIATIDHIRTTLLLFMGITTSVYWILLHRFFQIEDITARQANVALHWLAFAALLIDSLLVRPKTWLAPRVVWIWLLYPLLYGVYTLMRGAWVDWYPYPFIDVRIWGYASTLLINVLMGLGFFAVARGVLALHNRWLRRD